MSVWVQLLVHKLQIEELSHVDCQYFQIDECESFSKADALSTMERNEGPCLSFLAIRGQ